MNRKLGSFMLTALACAVAAHAQSSQTSGAIRGTVRARQGGAVAGAKVTARNLETGLTRSAVADASGAYVLGLLPVGPYEVRVEAQGFREGVERNLRVTLAEAVALNFSLDASEASATVEVTAQASQVDPTSVNTVSSIDEKLIAAVPLNGRNFTDLVQLTPGAPPNSQGYRTSIEGARGIGNNLMIDGASYNSKFNGEQRGGTRIPFAFGLDSIRELQVITNPFDVQYGDASGGVINAITKSGTNDFQGSVFTQLRPNSLVARIQPVPYDPYGTTNAPAALERHYSTTEYGFNVGGPIIKDKLHYFFNADFVHFSQDSVPTVSLSPSSGTAGDFSTFWGPGGMGRSVIASNDGLNLYQESMRPWTDDEKHLAAMGRLDWTLTPDHQATFRVNYQNYDAKNDIYAGVIKNNIAESNNSSIRYQSISWVAELNSVFGSSFLNQALLQLSTERRPETPNSTVSTSIDLPGFTAGRYYIDPRDTDETTTQLIDNATWLHGDWTLKGGLDWQFIHYRNTFFPDGYGEYNFKTWGAANQWFSGAITGSPSITYYQTWSSTNGLVQFDEKILASYLEAQYAGFLDHRLVLTFGGRYTREMYSDNPNPNPRVQGLDQMPDNGSFDPRVGFSLDLFGDNRTVLRGGFGLFSVTNPAQNVASAFMQNGQNTLPYKVSYNSSTAALFQSGGVLSASERIDANGYVTRVDPSLIGPGNTLLPLGSIQLTLIDPRARMAQARTALLGLEHDFGNGWVGKARGVYKKFTHLQYFMDINLEQLNPATNSWDPSIVYNDGYPYAYNHFATGTSSNRPGRAIVDGRSLDLSGYGAVGLSRFDGIGQYKALILELDKNSRDGFGFSGNLTLSSSRDSNSNERATAQAQASNPIDPSDPTAEARSDNDIPVRGVLIVYTPRFWGIRASANYVYASGYPWTPKYYSDRNQDGYFNDVALGGRNSERQPSSRRLNVKLSRDWRFSRRFQLQTDIEVYNLFNWANQTTSQTTYDTSSGALNPAFGYIDTTDKNTRSVQFALRLKF